MYILLPRQKVVDIATQDSMIDMERIVIQPHSDRTKVVGPATEIGALIDELVIVYGKETVDELVV